jgi:hypothetical protein
MGSGVYVVLGFMLNQNKLILLFSMLSKSSRRIIDEING